MTDYLKDWEISALDDSFSNASIYGKLEDLAELLKNLKLIDDQDKIYHMVAYSLSLACLNGHLNIVQHLFNSDDSKDYINIEAYNNAAIQYACKNGYLEIVEYLLTSPELMKHANINDDNDASFINVIKGNYLEIAKYLIFEHHLEKSQAIINFLQENPNECIEGMFKSRELSQTLEKELSSDKMYYQKVKIKI